jgi:PTH1 family peptidyl-tRNA hydrolase
VKCIVGLGNPGIRYRNTRHNAGFLAAEALIESWKARQVENNDLVQLFTASHDDQEVLVMMPQTFMNNSGEAVHSVLQQYTIDTANLLVIYDDFQLPFGTLRVRPGGSGGGHNGLGSIIDHLQTELVPRLRIGVGGRTIPAEHTHEAMAEYVLSPFDTEEQKLLPALLRHTCNACLSWIGSGISRTMNSYNRDFFSPASAG